MSTEPAYACVLHGNVGHDIADQCPDYVHGTTLLIRSCISCKHHAKNQPKEKKGVFITPKQRQEYINSAAAWWDGTGRHMVSQEKNSERAQRKFREASAVSAAIITTGPKETVIPSGILNGRMFHNLTPNEKGRVLKIWMHNFTPFQFADLSKREQELQLEDSVKQIITEH